MLLRDNGSAKVPAFMAGCAAAGFKVYNHLEMPRVETGDILLCWNRHMGTDGHAKAAEKRGARVIVAENGYAGADDRGKQFFALAIAHHNGAGEWKVGAPGRWATMNCPLKPWRTQGKKILLLPQRGIGEPGVKMPVRWAESTSVQIRAQTDRPVIIRRHPGRLHIPLEPDLVDVHCAVTWASGAGIKAIAAGIPVFYEFPQWIGAQAASPLRGAKGQLADLERPFMGDRLPMFERLAWAQWSLAEIESGQAITWLTS